MELDDNGKTDADAFDRVALDPLSVDEIDARIGRLKAEIIRCEDALKRKRGDLIAAEALFSPST